VRPQRQPSVQAAEESEHVLTVNILCNNIGLQLLHQSMYVTPLLSIILGGAGKLVLLSPDENLCCTAHACSQRSHV
jgi:hypothetical protein